MDGHIAMQVVTAFGERAALAVGDKVVVSSRSPIGHYRVPQYVRGKCGLVEAIIEPAAVNNEEEGFGRNAGSRLHYYRVAIPLVEVWPAYRGPEIDALRIEIFETWLSRLPL